jgi:hypothetical protein
MRRRTQKAIGSRPRREREGAVMLIVMMVLLVATTLASVSLQATQYELRAAGFARSAMQTQYVSEAAFATSVAWVDATALGPELLSYISAWNNTTPPELQQFGEPALTGTNRADSMRTQWIGQAQLTAVTMPPITLPGANNDPVGTFGPRVTGNPGIEDPRRTNALLSDYVVDMYDCQRLGGLGSPGAQVNQGGSGTIQQIQLYCVVTSRGRSYVPNAGNKVWQDSAGNDYTVNRFTLAHDSRGTIVTPPMIPQQ